MAWDIDTLSNRQVNVGGPAGRAVNQSSNPAQASQEREADVFRTGHTYMGIVTRADAGLYNIMVNIGSREITCIMAVSSINPYLGVCDCNIPTVGSRVLVYSPSASMGTAVILTVLPSANLISSADKDGNLPEQLTDALDGEPGKSAKTEKVYQNIIAGSGATIDASTGRPAEIFPGNRAWLNEQGVGVAILNVLAMLRGSERAKITVSAIDDAVRVISGYYQHINAQGTDQIYNDGGFLTREVSGTSYQCEKSGHNDYGSKLFKDREKGDPASARYGFAEDKIIPKKRFQLFLGHLGDLVNFFIAKPDPEQNPEKSDTDSKDQGLLQTHIDSSGRAIVRSAAGISLQRDDHIPVPKKKHEPWDPEGNKMEDASVELTAKGPFKWDENYPYARSLQLRDALAYRNMQAIQRLSDQDKDYYLPEEEDLDTPDDEYDKQGKGKEDYKKNANRKACINIEDDGSIILRDAWGTELIMGGGNITINCAGDIHERSGKSIVQLAGHDIITKARKSVDITATDNDVRVKANTNLHMVAEGRDGGGGVLIESKADGIVAFNGKGEATNSKGIIFKAKDSEIYMQANTLHASGKKAIKIETFDEDGENFGDIIIAAKNIYSNAKNNIMLTTGDETSLLLTSRQAILSANTAMIAGGNSLVLTRGAKAWIPFQEIDITSNPYETLKAGTENLYNSIQTSTAWLAPYGPEARADIQFTYRSSNEYGTLSASEVYGASKFMVYQASWAYLASIKDPLIGGTVETWEGNSIEDTYPWPGKEACDGTAYVKLESESNINSKTGIAKKRAELKDTPGKLIKYSFDEYEVMKI